MSQARLRIGLKWKAALLLALLLISILVVLSSLVLAGIKEDQRVRLEHTFAQEAEAANVRTHQDYLVNANQSPDDYMELSGQQLAVDLGARSGMAVTLYKLDGTLAGTSLPFQPKADVQDALTYTAKGRSAYITEGDQLLYLAPLYLMDEQIGTIQFHASLAEQHAFYHRIQRLFVVTGAAVLIAGFLIGYLYVWRQAHIIGKLNRAAQKIGEGEYLNEPTVKRGDELGELAQGIYEMSGRISSSVRQLTEEKQKLLEAVARLEELEQQQKQFIGNISHELKTPLTSIIAYADLLEMYRDDSDLLEEARERIREEAGRLYSLVEKSLQLSSLDIYDFQTKAEIVQIVPILHEAAERLQAKAEQLSVTIHTSLTEGTVWADPDNLMHIVLNLLDNGVKYNKRGGTVTITNHRAVDPQGAEQMVITIKDTGIGIPEEAKDRIFDPFYTVSSDRSRARGGTGLGLSLVRRLAEKQHGTVQLMHSGPEGSAFAVTLPIHRPDTAPDYLLES